MHRNRRPARSTHKLRDGCLRPAALNISVFGPQFRIEKYDSNKASCAPRPKSPPNHRRAKVLQLPSRTQRNQVRRRHTPPETKLPSIQVRLALAAARSENAAPRPTPSRAARFPLPRIRARSASFATALQLVRNALEANNSLQTKDRHGACHDVI